MNSARGVVTLGATLMAIAALVPLASGQDAGLRAGASINPDQFYFGAHVETPPLFEELRFRPNVEVGFGDNRTVVSLNPEFIYPFPLQNGMRAYVGAGPALNIISDDRPNRDSPNLEPGFNFLLGLDFRNDFFAEVKVGAIDSPDVKLGFGFTFR